MDQDNEVFSIAILAFMVFFIFTCFCKVKSDVENFVGGGSCGNNQESDLEETYQDGGRRRGGPGSGGPGSAGRRSGGRTDRLARRARRYDRQRLYRPRYYGNSSWLWNNYYPYYGNYFGLYNPWQVNSACVNIAARKCQGQYYYEPCVDSQYQECVDDQNISGNWYSMWFA